MNFTAKAASVLGYRVLPTAILAFISYLVIFLALGVTDTLPSVPNAEKQGGLDVKEALKDLQHIAARPHPYNSHANDKVRSYILSRLGQVALDYPYVHIVNDLTSNVSFVSGSGEYFEGTNILVKVDGTSDSDAGAVLFSAHYDSVSTSWGVTDDGMGVVTLMQLVEYFAENRQLRTAIFNVNNGEEDGLYGAHAFLEHPWSKLTDTFLNLEGAASGGRPILFRATSATPVRAARSRKNVPHPHANVVSSDAFARGFIRSGTDFSVYAGPGSSAGMAGLDIAFYKGRSRYHTKYDSLQYTLGGSKSLWSMMETSRGIGIGLLSAPYEGGEAVKENDDPVYLDLFKSSLIVFRLKNLLTFNIVLLVVGPILLILLVVFERFFLRGEEATNVIHEDNDVTPPPAAAPSGQGHPHLRYFQRSSSAIAVPGAHSDITEEPSTPQVNGHQGGQSLGWAQSVWRHAKFWVALVAVFVVEGLLVWGYAAINPFAIYSSPHIVFSSLLALAYLTLVFTLTLPSSLPFYHPKGLPTPAHSLLRPAQQQKQTIFFHFYAFTWLLLVGGTIGITRVTPGIGGGYLVSVWNALLAISCVLCVLEGLFTSSPWRKDEGYTELEGEGELPHRSHRHVEDANESTPLIWRGDEPRRARNLNGNAHDEEEHGGGSLATWWWIPQFLVSVPIPVILYCQAAMLLLDAMPQTLADGPSPWSVYALAVLPAVLIVLPLAPFAYKLRPYRPLTIFVSIVFILATLYAWLTFPFSVEAPLKIFFQQRVEFPEQHISSSAGSFPALVAPKLITALSGPPKYILDIILSNIPSAQTDGKGILCRGEAVRKGLWTCEWESGARMMPSPGTSSSQKEKWDKDQFFKASVDRTGPTSAQIRVKGQNTRSCRVYFDSSPLSDFAVWPPHQSAGALAAGQGNGLKKTDSGMQEGYEMGPQGVKRVSLWSRTWDREFGLDVDWSAFANKSDSTARGRVSCNWAEYESGTLENGTLKPPGTATNTSESHLPADGRAKIPAYEEVLTFLPDWVTATKYTDGLVEAWAPFVL